LFYLILIFNRHVEGIPAYEWPDCEQIMIIIDKSNIHDFVTSIINALEARDPYTAGHSNSVTDITELKASS